MDLAEQDLNSIKLWNSQLKECLEISLDTITKIENWSDEEPETPQPTPATTTTNMLSKEWFVDSCQNAAKKNSIDGLRMCVDILNLLRSKEVDIQSHLVDLIGYDSFDFLESLLTNRKTIVENITIEYNMLSPPELKTEIGQAPFGAQVTVVSKKEQDILKKARKLQRKQKNHLGRDDIDSAVLLGFEVDSNGDQSSNTQHADFDMSAYQQEENYPNVYQSNRNTSAISSYSNKFVLPSGTTRTDDMDKEEIWIPIPQAAPISASENLIPIQSFEPWVQPTFKGYKSLNRIQSIVYPIAFESNENMLICAPTGAVELIK